MSCPNYIKKECSIAIREAELEAYEGNEYKGCRCSSCFNKPDEHKGEMCVHCPAELREKYHKDFEAYYALNEL